MLQQAGIVVPPAICRRKMLTDHEGKGGWRSRQGCRLWSERDTHFLPSNLQLLTVYALGIPELPKEIVGSLK
ncbi:hypothetical protein CEXT_194651 [Caerostris extrusa]|uniref:Uncharacterized protein n=1 Tax=Caerostris extrusa TaxID=172846 RepID=A0AAV4XEA9_CAEEX|nr:hypothetical protein CEXT_194651 [Caerostris extrusa]